MSKKTDIKIKIIAVDCSADCRATAKTTSRCNRFSPLLFSYPDQSVIKYSTKNICFFLPKNFVSKYYNALFGNGKKNLVHTQANQSA